MAKKENVMTDEFAKKSKTNKKKGEEIDLSPEEEEKLKKYAKEYAQDVLKAADFKLDPHLISMMMGTNGEPFFSYWSRRITKIKTNVLPTAGVTFRDNDIQMLWNPIFFSKLEDKHIRGVLKHEFWHLILDHCVARRKEPHNVWNIATDCAINSMLAADELPETCIMPGRAYKDTDGKVLDDPLSKMIASFPTMKASDWYFSELMNNKEVREQMEKNGNHPGQFDSHDGWDELSDEEREILSGKVRSILSNAIKEADANNAWGSIPSAIREMLREMASNQIDWRAILREFCGMVRSSEKATTLKKINKKYPYQHPGYKRRRRANINVYVDQSGSVSDDEISLLFGELNELSKMTTFNVYFFDTAVDEQSKIVWRRGQAVKPLRTRCGGTDFSAPIKHANKNKDAIDGVLILTDGECCQPDEPSQKKLGWVITPNHKLNFAPRPQEVLIQMK